MKRSRKQQTREALTAEQVRERQARKAMEADRASFLLVGGQDAWQREQNRRRAARNERTRQRVRDVIARKREAEQQQPGLWGAA